MKRNKKGLRVLLVLALIICTFAAGTVNTTEVYAAQKTKLNSNLKLNTTKTYTRTGILKENDLFPKAKKSKIKYTVTSKRKVSGKNYVVTYDVSYKILDNPKISKKNKAEKYLYGTLIEPHFACTVFDSKTGQNLYLKNKLGVKVKIIKDWQSTFYPKQYYTDRYTGEKCWFRNYKTLNYSFSVTYPKSYKNAVVGIGFSNLCYGYDEGGANYTYWNGESFEYSNGEWIKTTYYETDFYKKGQKTMSYMKLNK